MMYQANDTQCEHCGSASFGCVTDDLEICGDCGYLRGSQTDDDTVRQESERTITLVKASNGTSFYKVSHWCPSFGDRGTTIVRAESEEHAIQLVVSRFDLVEKSEHWSHYLEIDGVEDLGDELTKTVNVSYVEDNNG